MGETSSRTRARVGSHQVYIINVVIYSNVVPLVIFQALHYMLLVSEVEETEIFKICLEYWNHLAAELYRESPFSTSTSPLLSGNQHFDVPPRRQLYLPVLSKVLQTPWAHTVAPQCVTVVTFSLKKDLFTNVEHFYFGFCLSESQRNTVRVIWIKNNIPILLNYNVI